VNQSSVFGYVSQDARVPKSHPCGRICQMVNAAPEGLSPEFATGATTGMGAAAAPAS
jgi:hypothetical protein